MDDVSQSISRLSPEQRAKLESRLREGRSVATPSVAAITPRADQAAWPMSAAQIRIWSLSRLRPADPVYNLQRAWRLQGSLQPSVLQAGIEELVRRHEELRASFADHGGTPAKNIRPFEGFELPVERTSNGSDPFGYAIGVAQAEAERAFDLTNDLLIRARLLELDHDDHVLMLTAHHLVCDGWSMDIIERDLMVVYADYLRGAPSSLEPLPFQYADVTTWQQEKRRASERRDLEYWEGRLAAPVVPLHLPRSGPRHSGHAPRGGHFEVTLDLELSSVVKKVSRDTMVTPFMTLLAAFQLALHQATGQEDIVVCSPTAGRPNVQTEQLVGYFNNLVVLRGDLSGDPSMHQHLERNRAMVLEAFDHQGVPFQDVAALPSVATVPLARGLFVLQETSRNPLELPGVSVTPMTVEAETADFEFGVFIREVGGRYRSVVRFHRNMFAPEDVQKLMSGFESALRYIIKGPDRPVSQFVAGAYSESSSAQELTLVDSVAGETRPRTLLESQLVQIWEDVFRSGSISIHDDFFDLGGHSLLAAALIAGIEEQVIGEPMPLATLFRAPTIAELSKVIEEKGWSESWASLVPMQPEGSRPPLFFVHAHGGNVLGYRELATRLGTDQPFYGLQAPAMNLDGPEIVPRRIEEIATQYVEELRTVQRQGPYLLGGWCLGGDVAFEMAHQLEAAGEDVAMLVMVDNPRPEYLALSVAVPVWQRAWNRARTRLDMEWSNLVEVPWVRRPRFLVERASRLGQGALVRCETLVGRWVPIPHSRAYDQERIVAAHEKAYQAYDPKPYSGPVTLLRAEQQPFGRAADSTLGWDPYVEGKVDVIEAPGHRVGLLSEPRVQVVAEQVRGAMAKGLGDRKTSGP